MSRRREDTKSTNGKGNKAPKAVPPRGPSPVIAYCSFLFMNCLLLISLLVFSDIPMFDYDYDYDYDYDARRTSTMS